MLDKFKVLEEALARLASQDYVEEFIGRALVDLYVLLDRFEEKKNKVKK